MFSSGAARRGCDGQSWEKAPPGHVRSFSSFSQTREELVAAVISGQGHSAAFLQNE